MCALYAGDRGGTTLADEGSERGGRPGQEDAGPGLGAECECSSGLLLLNCQY